MDDCDREGRLWSSSNASWGEGVGLQFMKGAAGSEGGGSEVKGAVREKLRLCVEQQLGAHMDDCDQEARLWSSSNASRGEGVGLQFMKGAVRR